MNKRYRPPKVAITTAMLMAANTVLERIEEIEEVTGNPVGDATMVAKIFTAMWDAYWCEIHATAEKKHATPAIVMSKSTLVLPRTN